MTEFFVKPNHKSIQAVKFVPASIYRISNFKLKFALRERESGSTKVSAGGHIRQEVDLNPPGVRADQ